MTRTITHDQRERKRLHLLEVAAAEFARVGFDGANINVISELAGFGKGTVYLYAASKEQLFLDVLREIGAQTRRALDDSLFASVGAPVVTRLRLVSEAFVQLAERYPDFVRLQASALFGVNRRFQSVAASTLRQAVETVARAFEDEMARHALRHVASDALAILLLGSLQTFVMLPDVLGLGPGTTADQVAFIVDMLWSGLAPAEAIIPAQP